jgi:hypothetical protein
MTGGLRVQELGRRWVMVGDDGETPALANEFLDYLANRNCSPRTVGATLATTSPLAARTSTRPSVS